MLKLATKFNPQRALMQQAWDAGYRNAELWLDARILAEVNQIVPLAREFDFEYVIHSPNRTDLSNETLDQMVALYRGLNCRCAVVHQPVYDRFHEVLLGLCPEIRLAIENHRLSPAEFYVWEQQSPYLTLDVEHVWMFTMPEATLPELLKFLHEFLELSSPKLRHVHLPGYTPGYDEHRPMYCNRDLVYGMFSMLAEFHFDGLIVSESENEFQNPRDLRMDVLLYEGWQAHSQATS
ncbi:MAG: hypothetical protein U0903_14810 [Planctomycetales bacterium]